jgi:hypothetical protein
MSSFLEWRQHEVRRIPFRRGSSQNLPSTCKWKVTNKRTVPLRRRWSLWYARSTSAPSSSTKFTVTRAGKGSRHVPSRNAPSRHAPQHIERHWLGESRVPKLGEIRSQTFGKVPKNRGLVPHDCGTHRAVGCLHKPRHVGTRLRRDLRKGKAIMWLYLPQPAARLPLGCPVKVPQNRRPL